MKFIYYIIHTFTGCKDEDLKYFKNNMSECEKCGRVTFIFKTYK